MLPSAFQELVDLTLRAESVEDLHGICSKICEAFDFSYFIYGTRLPTSFIKPQIAVISGFPADWWAHYKACGYMRIDPTIAHCARRLTPLLWKDIKDDPKDPQRTVQKLLAESRDYGLRSGVSFPAHGGAGESAILSLVSEAEHAKAEHRIIEALPYGHLLTGYIHEAAKRVFTHRDLPIARVQLTPREKECLQWAAEGKTTWETAKILNISERTVIFHIQNATGKLHVSNRQHAIARAVSQNLITPQFS